MIKRSVIRSIMASFIISVLAFAMTAIFYTQIPDQVALIEGYFEPKNRIIWLLPVLTLVVGIIISMIPIVFRKIEHNETNLNFNYQSKVTSLVCSALLFMQIIFVCGWLNYTIGIWSVAIAAFGFLIALIGNYMPRFTRHSAIGIYNPWTLANDLVWKKTHRFGGYVWLFGGIAIIFMILVPKSFNLWLVFGIFILILLIPNFYSFFYARYKKIGL